MMCVNVFFYITRNNISVGSDKKMRNVPIDSIYKNHPLCNVISIDMTLQKWAIFIMGVYGDFFCLLSDQAEILFLVIKKNVDTS